MYVKKDMSARHQLRRCERRIGLRKTVGARRREAGGDVLVVAPSEAGR
jgi:hypothetical protein